MDQPVVHPDALVGAGSTWTLPEPEPTNLVIAWPGAEAPGADEALGRLEAALGAAPRVVDRPAPDDPALPWVAVARLAGVSAPVALWVEPARAPSAAEDLAPGVEAARWTIGAETVLDPADPLRDWAALVRGLAVAIPEAPAVLDVNCAMWHPRAALSSLLESNVEPPLDALWIIQAIAATPDRGADSVWLHTHGLWRCGRPELEMLDVPADSAPAAAGLLHDVTMLLMEEPWPAPGEPLEIGPDLAVTLQPWAVVARELPPGAPGGRDARSAEHGGVRAAVCGATPQGAPRPSWRWPAPVVERRGAGTGAVYRPRRATERQGHLARATWRQLGRVWSRLGSPDGAVLVEAAGHRGDEAETGHAWFRAAAIDLDGAEVIPIVRETDAGSRRLPLERISDWRLVTAARRYAPDDAPALEALGVGS